MPPIAMAGQAAPVVATSPAAISTPTSDATSLPEHSNVFDMLTFSDLNCHSNARHTRLTPSAALPNAIISVDEGGTPFTIFSTNSTTTAMSKARMIPPLAIVARNRDNRSQVRGSQRPAQRGGSSGKPLRRHDDRRLQSDRSPCPWASWDALSGLRGSPSTTVGACRHQYFEIARNCSIACCGPSPSSA